MYIHTYTVQVEILVGLIFGVYLITVFGGILIWRNSRYVLIYNLNVVYMIGRVLIWCHQKNRQIVIF